MELINSLKMLVVILVCVAIALAFVYIIIALKQKNGTTKSDKNKQKAQSSQKEEEKIRAYKEYTKESIFDFMEFEEIQDNMILQKKGKRFLMVIECQGINYDLMSEVEKNSVEVGFMKTLNTLRDPIQIYVQTRTVNLESSLANYKERLGLLKDELMVKQNKYRQMQEDERYTEEEIRKQMIEVMKQENLCAYGNDIVVNTERMSRNKNILRKKYYIITSYYALGSENEFLDKEEIRESAFSELYTRCQSLVRALSSTGVTGRVMNSRELVDLLYNAYNRDEAEIFGVNKAEEASYDSMYVTAPDVLERRKKALDAKVENEALNKAEDAILFANKQVEIEEQERNMDILVAELAKQLIDENEQYLGEEVVEKAKEHVDKTTKAKGGKASEKKTKTTRSRSKSITG